MWLVISTVLFANPVFLWPTCPPRANEDIFPWWHVRRSHSAFVLYTFLCNILHSQIWVWAALYFSLFFFWIRGNPRNAASGIDYRFVPQLNKIDFRIFVRFASQQKREIPFLFPAYLRVILLTANGPLLCSLRVTAARINIAEMTGAAFSADKLMSENNTFFELWFFFVIYIGLYI